MQQTTASVYLKDLKFSHNLQEELSRAKHHIEILNLEKNSFKAMVQALLDESQDNRDNQWISAIQEKDKIISTLVRKQRGNEEVKQLEKLLIQEREARRVEKEQSERNLSQVLMQLGELKKVVVSLEKENEMNKVKIMEYYQSLQKQNHLREDFIQLQEQIEQLQSKVEEIEAEKEELIRAIDTKQKREVDNFDSQKIQAILSIEGQKQLEIEAIERQNAQLAELVLNLQDELAERQIPQDHGQINSDLQREIHLQLNILFQLANQSSAFIKTLLEKHFGSIHDFPNIFADVSLYPSLILGLLLFIIDILSSISNDHRIRPFTETARFDDQQQQTEELNHLLLAPSIKDIQQKIALSRKNNHILENEGTFENKDDLITEVSKQELVAPSIPQIDKDSFLMSNNNQQLFLAIQNEQQENYPNMMSQFLREDTQSSVRDNQNALFTSDQSPNLDIISQPSAFKTTQEFNPRYDEDNLKYDQQYSGRLSQNNENEKQERNIEGKEEQLQDSNTITDQQD